MPLNNGIYLKILHLLKLKFAKINKRGGPNKVRGGRKKFQKNNKRGVRLLGTEE